MQPRTKGSLPIYLSSHLSVRILNSALIAPQISSPRPGPVKFRLKAKRVWRSVLKSLLHFWKGTAGDVRNKSNGWSDLLFEIFPRLHKTFKTTTSQQPLISFRAQNICSPQHSGKLDRGDGGPRLRASFILLENCLDKESTHFAASSGFGATSGRTQTRGHLDATAIHHRRCFGPPAPGLSSKDRRLLAPG
ncbi:uncharacterized protein PV07_03314 [Cladophialophora immunda]|uniref:Uncharacterized protein n=1 Tax=Cladophialophora immunda TaxID=569365 RepID=A0A0D2D7I9_9EURO|nr:uncharacterized protein PV07_03314 [Cladophialophora immunda]KIW31714.1 hypothetical protein PV07_03314 [Cladophialophora immunda]